MNCTYYSDTLLLLCRVSIRASVSTLMFETAGAADTMFRYSWSAKRLPA